MNPGPMLSKIAGWQLLGQSVGEQLPMMRSDTFVLCDDYMQTAETAFYVPGQPITYCAGPYYLSDPKRLTQYDMWKDRSLEPTVDGKPNPLIGRDCIYVGKGGEIPPVSSDASVARRASSPAGSSPASFRNDGTSRGSRWA